ncbi:lipoprotein, putative [Staphylococcus aureus]|nr:lipoprotein, putative [Staphylococcus aureus]CAC7226948.1 lipoprotein, putative [Staphylococcus aureus]
MTTKENIDILRKPGAQALSLASLFMILFSCLTFFFGLDYERFPNYLKITTIIELIIIVISLLQWIRVKSRLLCKMLYNVFTISTYQN